MPLRGNLVKEGIQEVPDRGTCIWSTTALLCHIRFKAATRWFMISPWPGHSFEISSAAINRLRVRHHFKYQMIREF